MVYVSMQEVQRYERLRAAVDPHLASEVDHMWKELIQVNTHTHTHTHIHTRTVVQAKVGQSACKATWKQPHTASYGGQTMTGR